MTLPVESVPFARGWNADIRGDSSRLRSRLRFVPGFLARPIFRLWLARWLDRFASDLTPAQRSYLLDTNLGLPIPPAPSR